MQIYGSLDTTTFYLLEMNAGEEDRNSVMDRSPSRSESAGGNEAIGYRNATPT